MKINVRVSAYVSTITTVEVPDNFDFSNKDAVQALANRDSVQCNLQDNSLDCISDNAVVEEIYNENTDKVLYTD